jgi:lipid-A-disaccharide synthase
MLICYRVSLLTQLMGHALLRVPWIGLANLALGRGVVPELFLRSEVTAERLATEALALLDTPGALDAQREAFHELAELLGEPGVGERAARLVLTTAGVAA